jgi:hypothetical protein
MEVVVEDLSLVLSLFNAQHQPQALELLFPQLLLQVTVEAVMVLHLLLDLVVTVGD